MKSVLKMPFNMDNGKSRTISLENPKVGLTLAEAQTAMSVVVTNNAITDSYGGEPIGYGTPYIYQTNEIALT